LTALALAAGCSGDNNNGADMGAATSLKVLFSPMYTYWDGMHTFQIPAVAQGQGFQPTDVNWNVSDPNKVSIAPDPMTGGIMITVANQVPGLALGGAATHVTVSAVVGGATASSDLTITPAVEADDWHDGALRYSNGIDARPINPDMGAVDTMAACTNCHGPTGTSGPFNDVSHTPEQIGGFSDADLDMIIRQGTVPAGGYFDTSIVSMDKWHSFHQWQMTDEELKGLLVYLRGLSPMPQKGTANFGGNWNGFLDGGI
jgi:hypothetical protein